jgi:transcriptional regulator with XRE-family HTH domain
MSEDNIQCPRCMGQGFLTPATATVGDMVARRRQLLGLTQSELAAQVGVSRPQVANIEAGRSDPQVSQLRKYADALQCQIKDLIP